MKIQPCISVIQSVTYLSACFMAVSIASFAPLSHADGYCGSEQTVFFCKTTNKKQIKVCKTGSKYTYQYGRINKKPELTLRRDMMVDKVFYIPWSGIGHDITQTLAFESGATTYSVYSVNQRMALGQTNGGVLAERYGKTLTNVSCLPNTIIDNLCTENCGIALESDQ